MTTSVARRRDEKGRFLPGGTEMVSSAELNELREAIGYMQANEMRLTERLEAVDRMVDERGWTPLYDYDSNEGLSLETIHRASKQLREMVVGNPFMKRGSQLRVTYTVGTGFDVKAVKADDSTSKTTLTAEQKKVVSNDRNQRNIFGRSALETMERAMFTDGTVFVLGDDEKRAYSVIPLSQIQGMLHNPDDTAEIWAFRRVWHRDPNNPTGEATVRWYYTDSFEGVRKTRIKHKDKLEVIDPSKTIIDGSVNRQHGWALGVPDGLAALAYAKLYREFLMNGVIMSRALAQFAFRATAKNQNAAGKAALEVGKSKDAGSTVVTSDDFSPLATAGRGYDFSSGRPIAAAIAAALEVSLIGLTSDPGAGGGGYGTAQTLDPPARATAAMRRAFWEEFYNRIMRHAGLKDSNRIKIVWHDLIEDGIHRQMQAIIGAWNSGLFEGTVIQGLMAEILGMQEPGSVPEGALTPNNEKTAGLSKSSETGQTVSPTAGSGQGQSNPAGQQPDDHDDGD